MMSTDPVAMLTSWPQHTLINLSIVCLRQPSDSDRTWDDWPILHSLPFWDRRYVKLA